MTTDRQLAFDTLAIHAGTAPDPATGARQVPIYQTTAYVFRDADHAAKLFNLQEVGYIYSRLTNPTVSALANRVCALEGGAGAICCSSGHAAQIMALFPLMGPGRNIIASTRLYGGTVTQFSQTIKRFGWSAKFVDLDDLDAVKAAIDADTRAIFCETIANPGGYTITELGDGARLYRVRSYRGVGQMWREADRYEPGMDTARREELLADWKRAVERSCAWARCSGSTATRSPHLSRRNSPRSPGLPRVRAESSGSRCRSPTLAAPPSQTNLTI